mmetsp:Transcript_48417/g.115121  ORF Transcript_48417/g.115121 Transcript_48417/m.115121 type:complete len:474 (+) Transcript_48417:310-1731(+)
MTFTSGKVTTFIAAVASVATLASLRIIACGMRQGWWSTRADSSPIPDSDPEQHRRLSEQEQQSPQIKVHYGTPNAPLAETALEFKYMLKEIVLEQGGFATEQTLGKYTEADVEEMMRGLRASHDVNEGFWRRSGKTSLNHGIGTGACMLLSRAPAAYVNTAILHGAYFSYWKSYKRGESTHPAWTQDVCPRRSYLQEKVGEASEKALWRYYSVYSGAPEPEDPSLWHQLFDGNVLPKMDKHLLLFDICDDIEQFQHDEQMFVNNDKNHRKLYTKKLLMFIDRLAKDPDMQHLDLKVLRQYTERVYGQIEDWFFDNPEKHDDEFQIRDSLELAYRNGGNEVVLPFAHVKHIKHNVLWCRQPIHFETCKKHWQDLINYWEEACCERGGPCEHHGEPGWWTSLPTAELGLPDTMPDILDPMLTPSVVHRTDAGLKRDREHWRPEDYGPLATSSPPPKGKPTAAATVVVNATQDSTA